MLDDEFKVILIECNTNPCLAVPCPLLSCIISKVIDYTFWVALDPIFFPSDEKKNKLPDTLPDSKIMLIFVEEYEEADLKWLHKMQSFYITAD